jgi:hypothetical protein
VADVPEVYSDQFTITLSPYGVALTFSLTPSLPSAAPSQSQPVAQAVVRMSLEHAKVVSMLLRKHIRQYELEHLGDPVPLPRDVLQSLRLAEADW